jgi:PAS domain S-box-containing protein
MAKAAPSAEKAIDLLVVGERSDDLAYLRRLLDQALNGSVQVDWAYSPDEALETEKKHDLVLWDCSGRENGFSLSDKSAASIFLGDPVHEQKVLATVQACVGDSAECHSRIPCRTLALLGVLEKFQKERQRQNSEETLRKLRSTVEQLPDLVMITDASGVLEYVNPAFEALTGYTREEVIGQTLGILKSEQQAGELYEEMWNTVLSGNSFHDIVTNRKKNGENFVLEKAITPLRNAAGQITHFISTGRDITGQRQLESQLQQAQKMDAIGRLAGGVAHDFNNLLMVISAYAELMLDSLAADHPLRRNVGEIVTASRRAADLTRQLLAFSRKQMQALQVLDLNRVIAEIGRMLPRLVGEDVQFRFIPGEDLNKVKADPVQIEQVVMNLAANARDAMPRGGTLTVETANFRLDETYVDRHSMVPVGDYVLLTVTDTGEGIPREYLPHIFEPFFTTKEEGKGTGLGLATVYGIVKQSGGFIWVYSEPGQGTTFKIYLPRVRQESDVVRATSAEENCPHGSETILLVEDEAAVRESTREFLTRSGYTVVEAANGDEALRASREFAGPIQLLISDVVMPRMSGPQLADQLCAERPGMRRLFVSGYAENTVLRHGAIDVTSNFLSKPFCLSALAKKIRDILPHQERAKHASAN